MKNQPQMCEWFALCDRVAVTTRNHPILGEVPICDRCDNKVRRIEAQRQQSSQR